METLDKLARAVSSRQEPREFCYHLFLTSSLSQRKTRQGYKTLAALMRDGYFSTLLTANEDTELEDALSDLGLEYHVLVIGQHSDEQIVEALDSEEENSLYIVKLSGSGLPPVSFDSLPESVQRSLERYFTHNIIIIGCMDQEAIGISALASYKRSGIYYILENDPSPTDIVVQCIEKSGKELKNFLITGPFGEFNVFFSALDIRLKTRASQRQTVPLDRDLFVPSPPSPKSPSIQGPSPSEKRDAPLGPQATRPLPIIPEPKRTNIFISYSHKNSMHLERLRTYLKLLERQGLIYIKPLKPWTDKEIKTGDFWREEIMRAIASAKIAILLISIDFLASDFIMDVEWPALQKGINNGEIIIIPVVIGSYDYGTTEFADFQAVNISRPLSMKADDEENDKVWKDVANRLREILIPPDPS